MPDLSSLRVFVAAAETLSFSHAAIRLGVSQPTVSRIVQDLETYWGEPLFYRTGRGVELSEFGVIAFSQSCDLLAYAEQTMTNLREVKHRLVGQVTIGVPPSLVGFVVPELAQQLSNEEPGIRLRVREGFSDQIDSWVKDGTVDIGLVSKYRESEHQIQGEIFCSPLLLAGNQKNTPAPATIDFLDIVEKPLVLPSAPNGLRLAIEAAARRLRVELNVFVDAESIIAQKKVAEKCGCYMVKAAYSLDPILDDNFDTSLIVNPRIWRAVVVRITQTRPLTKPVREVGTRTETIMRNFPWGEAPHI